jgi:hypothetical protein
LINKSGSWQWWASLPAAKLPFTMNLFFPFWSPRNLTHHAALAIACLDDGLKADYKSHKAPDLTIQ